MHRWGFAIRRFSIEINEPTAIIKLNTFCLIIMTRCRHTPPNLNLSAENYMELWNVRCRFVGFVRNGDFLVFSCDGVWNFNCRDVAKYEFS